MNWREAGCRKDMEEEWRRCEACAALVVVVVVGRCCWLGSQRRVMELDVLEIGVGLSVGRRGMGEFRYDRGIGRVPIGSH